MKILANLTALVKKTDANLPFGKTIQDETDTQPGTPIVADLMRDLFSNFYRLLELSKITPTNEFDGDSTQYQLIDALKKLPNSMNDIEQVLTLDGSVWSVPLDLSILPNKYVFFARATDDYNSDTSLSAPDYTFKGTGATEYVFTSQENFITGEELIIIIDIGGVRAYPIKKPKSKIYKGLVSQTELLAPTFIKNENSLGEITYQYVSNGTYKLVSDGLFKENKTNVYLSNGSSNGDECLNSIFRDSDNEIYIRTYLIDSGSGTLSLENGVLNLTSISVEVYN